MAGRRPGQIRFEAWLPADTYRRFSAKVGNRKAWLLAQVEAELGKEAAAPNGQHASAAPPEPGHG